jgi:hypothetical protein
MTKLHILSTVSDINWYDKSVMASERLRISYIVKSALSLGYQVTTGPNIPSSAQVVVAGKLTMGFGLETVNHFLNQLQNCSAKIIVDYTDNWLAKPQSETGKIYQILIKLSDAVSIPVQGLSRMITKPKESIFLIPDGLDNFGRFSPSRNTNAKKQVLWFGHPSNIPALLDYLDGEFGLNKFILNVVSNQYGLDKVNEYRFTHNENFEIRNFLWSLNTLYEVRNYCDLKILPTQKPFASANRLLTAFNLGLPVIASDSEAHKPFSEFYAKAGTNQAKKLFENPTRWHKKVTFAQGKSSILYSDKKILEGWSGMFGNLNL